jgi:hypothetical protein
MAQGLFAFLGSIDGDLEDFHDLALADHIRDGFGAQERVVFGGDVSVVMGREAACRDFLTDIELIVYRIHGCDFAFSNHV